MPAAQLGTSIRPYHPRERPSHSHGSSSLAQNTSFPLPPDHRKLSKDLHWEQKAVLVPWVGMVQWDSSCPHCVPAL